MNKKLWIGVIVLSFLVTIAATLIISKRFSSPPPAAQSNEQKKAAAKYTCPMHPNVVSDKPGSCPICHMDLVLAEEDTAPHSSHGDQNGENDPAGRTGFNLSQEKQQLIGVTQTTIEVRPLTSDIRATGRVAFDPDLFTAIEEYRQALSTRNQMNKNPYGELKDQSEQTLHSAKTKLRLMGLGDAQIQTLSDQKIDTMNLLLPSGTVWIYAEVFEYEMASLKPGQKLEVESQSLPGKAFSGRITSISPIVNSPTRTVRVRAQVPDPQGLLRPETYVNVKIQIEHGKKLAVPEDSVLNSGNQTFVFLVKDEGRFEPRAIKTGFKAGSYYEVLSGLEEGDKVVTAANFLIDSESRLKSALKNMSTPKVKSRPSTNTKRKSL